MSASSQRRPYPDGPLMTKAQIAAQIKHIIQNQLDDCERAIKAGTRSIALKELEDAVRQLKRLAALLEA
jgi:3-deoxy-D-manno-octulosonic acid (KDO) 8-phosphate synthase